MRLSLTTGAALLAGVLLLVDPGLSQAQRRGGGGRGGHVSGGHVSSGVRGGHVSVNRARNVGVNRGRQVANVRPATGYRGGLYRGGAYHTGYGYRSGHYGYPYGYGGSGYGLFGLGLGYGLANYYGLGYGGYYGPNYGWNSTYSYLNPYYDVTYGYGYNPAVDYSQTAYPPIADYTSVPSPAATDSARILVTVPANAELWFDGVLTAQTGPVREFQTPPLDPASPYTTYQVRARWLQNSQVMDQTQSVRVQPGRESFVDFTNPMPQ